MGSYNFRSLDNGVLSIGRTETAEELDDPCAYDDIHANEVEHVKIFLDELEDSVFNHLVATTNIGEDIGGTMFEIGYGYYDGFQTLADTWKLEQYLDNVDFESKRKFDYAKLRANSIAFINYALANYAKENGYQECYGSWCGSTCEIPKEHFKGKPGFKKRYEQLRKDYATALNNRKATTR